MPPIPELRQWWQQARVREGSNAKGQAVVETERRMEQPGAEQSDRKEREVGGRGDREQAEEIDTATNG
jgi:hypothetical protein